MSSRASASRRGWRLRRRRQRATRFFGINSSGDKCVRVASNSNIKNSRCKRKQKTGDRKRNIKRSYGKVLRPGRASRAASAPGGTRTSLFRHRHSGRGRVEIEVRRFRRDFLTCGLSHVSRFGYRAGCTARKSANRPTTATRGKTSPNGVRHGRVCFQLRRPTANK